MVTLNEREQGLISIIMPTYKRGEMIIEAINSVLMQTYMNFEVIVVDDCSPDNTKEILEKQYGYEPRVKYYRNEKNSGAGVTRKNGYLRSKGQFLIFMDDDDYLTDEYFFEKAMKVFKTSQEELSFVSANSVIKYENTGEMQSKVLNVKNRVDNKEYLKGFQTKYMKPNSTFTTVFQAKYIKNIDSVEMLNDSSIYMRALLTKPAYILDDSVGVYRVHDKNITFNLKLSFLLENLQEKKNIYDIIKQEAILDTPEEWLYEQIMLTADYYVSYSKPMQEEFDTLIQWCKENMGEDSDRLIKQLTSKYTISKQEKERKKID